MNLPFQVDLSGKVAVVTGGGGVLCSVLAKALGACGAKVAILNRTLEKGERVAREIGDNAMALEANVLDIASLSRARETVLNTWGRPTILLNGAGGNNPVATTDDEQYDPAAEAVKDFFQLDPQGVRNVFDLNYQGTLLPTQVFAKDMIGMPGASIVNITSMGAYLPLTKVGAYSGAKAAVSNLTMWLSTYFAKAGLRVNGIAPGFFVTGQNKGMLYTQDGTPTARTEKILHATPMGRFGDPQELVGALLYLVSEQAAGFVTGVVIPVDGGFAAYPGV